MRARPARRNIGVLVVICKRARMPNEDGLGAGSVALTLTFLLARAPSQLGARSWAARASRRRTKRALAIRWNVAVTRLFRTKILRSRALTMSLSGRLTPFNKRRERTMVSRSRRTLLTFHGRSKRWLEVAFSMFRNEVEPA